MLRGHCGWASPGMCFHIRAGTGGKQGGCTRMWNNKTTIIRLVEG